MALGSTSILPRDRDPCRGWMADVFVICLYFLPLRVNSYENVTEERQFTHLKMLPRPAFSFLLVCCFPGAARVCRRARLHTRAAPPLRPPRLTPHWACPTGQSSADRSPDARPVDWAAHRGAANAPAALDPAYYWLASVHRAS